MRDKPIPGDTPHERVISVLKQDHPRPAGRPAPHRGAHPGVHVRRRLRAAEIHDVGMLLTSMLTRAMHPERDDELTDEDVAIARVIGDVWLSALVGWVTGRTTAADVTRRWRSRSAAPPRLTPLGETGASARSQPANGRWFRSCARPSRESRPTVSRRRRGWRSRRRRWRSRRR